jgi:hypothetical protein
MSDTDTISLTRQQLRRLLTRFSQELDTKGGAISNADLEKVATRLVDELSPTCTLTGAQKRSPMLNSNVVVKVS